MSPDERVAPREIEDPPLPRAAAVFAVILYLVSAVLAAAIAFLLIPLRAGTVLVPVAILIAAATNVVLPWLTRRAGSNTLVTALPVVFWFITVAALTTSRPEGDILLPGSSDYQGLDNIFYAVAIIGIGAGAATVVRTDPYRRTRRPGPNRPGVFRPRGSVPLTPQPPQTPKRLSSRPATKRR